jgi:glycosyltransferase involved in cell wall biosynthesis
MPSLWFIVPAHGRAKLAAICLRQLRRTCDALTEHGVEAAAVVVADDENSDTARELGFAVIPRANHFPSQKFNDGIQLALDERFNPRPADYVVPLGSDDWVDWRLFRQLPPVDTMVGFQKACFVEEDGRTMWQCHLANEGGSGIRIYSRQIMQHAGFRPADEDRRRGCDTSMLVNLRRACRFQVVHRRLDPRQIVDWKSPGQNLNPFRAVAARWRPRNPSDPFEDLVGIYPDEALEEMQAHYASELVAA